MVFVHIEAPDEAGHHGDVRNKVSAIERIDRDIVGPIAKALRQTKEYRLLVLPDHPTPLSRRTHTSGPVPFVLSGRDVPARGVECFSERSAAETGLVVRPGHRLMEVFLGREEV